MFDRALGFICLFNCALITVQSTCRKQTMISSLEVFQFWNSLTEEDLPTFSRNLKILAISELEHRSHGFSSFPTHIPLLSFAEYDMFSCCFLTHQTLR